MRLRLLTLALFFFPVFMLAQNTANITGTLIDSDSQAWVNASWTAVPVIPGGGGKAHYKDGSPVPSSFSGALSSSGVFTGVVGRTSQMVPTGTNLRFTINSVTSATPSVVSNVIVSATTFNGGIILSPLITAPRFNAGNLTYAYNTTEILNPVNGTGYTRTTDQTCWLFNGTSYQQVCAPGAGIVPAAPSFAVQIANNGVTALIADPTATINPTTHNFNANVNSEKNGTSFSSTAPMLVGGIPGSPSMFNLGSINSGTPSTITCTGCFPFAFIGTYAYRIGDQTNGEKHGTLTRVDANTATMSVAWTGPTVSNDTFYFGPDTCTTGNAWFAASNGGSAVLPSGYFVTSCSFVQGNNAYLKIRGSGFNSTAIVYTGEAVSASQGCIVDLGTFSGGGQNIVEDIALIGDDACPHALFAHSESSGVIRNVYIWETTAEAFAVENMVGQVVDNLIGRPTAQTILNSTGCVLYTGTANGPGGNYTWTCEHGTGYGINAAIGQMTFYSGQLSSSQKLLHVQNATVNSRDSLWENIGTPGNVDIDAAGVFSSDDDSIFGPINNFGQFYINNTSLNGNSLTNQPSAIWVAKNYRYGEGTIHDLSSTTPMWFEKPYNIGQGHQDTHGPILQHCGFNSQENGVVDCSLDLDLLFDETDIPVTTMPLFSGAVWEMDLYSVDAGDDGVPFHVHVNSANPTISIPGHSAVITFSLKLIGSNYYLVANSSVNGIFLYAKGVLHPHKFPNTYTDDFISVKGSISRAGLPTSIALITGAASFTPATGIAAVNCNSPTCTNVRGIFTVNATAGVAPSTIVTVTFPTTTVPYSCVAHQLGGAVWFGIGASSSTATSFNLTSDVALGTGTVTVDYLCTP